MKNKDLAAANEMLTAEVRQRARTEEELRKSDESSQHRRDDVRPDLEIDEDARYTYISRAATCSAMGLKVLASASGTTCAWRGREV
jgi:hypothetical protein